MPIYEYRCLHCGHMTEIMWSVFDGGPALQPCENCHQQAHKVLSHVLHKNKKKGKP